jgi:hypothetical protein
MGMAMHHTDTAEERRLVLPSSGWTSEGVRACGRGWGLCVGLGGWGCTVYGVRCHGVQT